MGGEAGGLIYRLNVKVKVSNPSYHQKNDFWAPLGDQTRNLAITGKMHKPHAYTHLVNVNWNVQCIHIKHENSHAKKAFSYGNMRTNSQFYKNAMFFVGSNCIPEEGSMNDNE